MFVPFCLPCVSLPLLLPLSSEHLLCHACALFPFAPPGLPSPPFLISPLFVVGSVMTRGGREAGCSGLTFCGAGRSAVCPPTSCPPSFSLSYSPFLSPCLTPYPSITLFFIPPPYSLPLSLQMSLHHFPSLCYSTHPSLPPCLLLSHSPSLPLPFSFSLSSSLFATLFLSPFLSSPPLLPRCALSDGDGASLEVTP